MKVKAKQRYKKNEEWHTVAIRGDLYDKLDAIAEKAQVTVPAIVDRIIRKGLDRPKIMDTLLDLEN